MFYFWNLSKFILAYLVRYRPHSSIEHKLLPTKNIGFIKPKINKYTYTNIVYSIKLVKQHIEVQHIELNEMFNFHNSC